MKKSNNINIPEIEKKIGYTFKDKSLLIQAFTRTSFCNEESHENKVRHQSNEVLEFFGDGVLSVAIISFLMAECTERYEYGIKTELAEGDFSNIKSKLSDKQNLSKSMKSLGLQKYLRMGEGDTKLGIQNEPSVMEDLFESIVGAIYIDSDMSISAVIKAVSGMLDMSVYTDKQKPMQSAKNLLQEWCADKRRRLPAPRYETISEDGPDHKKTYMRACYIGDRIVGRGIGKNYKLADAAAAEDALQALMAEENGKMQTEIGISAQKSAPKSEKSPTAKSSNPPKKSTKKPVEKFKTEAPATAKGKDTTKSVEPKKQEKEVTPKPEKAQDKPAERETPKKKPGAEKASAAVKKSEEPKQEKAPKQPTEAKQEKATKKPAEAKPSTPTKKPESAKSPAKAAPKKASTPTTAPQPKKAPAKKPVEEQPSGTTILKEYALNNKKPTPIFKDLGVIKSNGRMEYRVECRFDGERVVGTGLSRTDAREAATKMMLDIVGIGKSKPTAKKATVSKGIKNPKK